MGKTYSALRSVGDELFFGSLTLPGFQKITPVYALKLAVFLLRKTFRRLQYSIGYSVLVAVAARCNWFQSRGYSVLVAAVRRCQSPHPDRCSATHPLGGSGAIET